MSHRTTKNNAAHLIPFQVKTRSETRTKIKRIAEQSGLSANDVAGMAISAGIDLVETKLREMRGPSPVPQAA